MLLLRNLQYGNTPSVLVKLVDICITHNMLFITHNMLFMTVTHDNCSVTYSMAIPQWYWLISAATAVRDRPMREIVGAIVRGPIYLRKKPIRPVHPSTN